MSTWCEMKYMTELYSLWNYNKVMGFFALFALLSLAGIPPFPGFFAKILVLRALFMEGFSITFYFILFLSIASTVYYIRLIRMLFFSESSTYSGPLIVSATITQFYLMGFVGVLNFYILWKH